MQCSCRRAGDAVAAWRPCWAVSGKMSVTVQTRSGSRPSLRGDGRACAGGRRLLPLAVAVGAHRGLQRGQLGVQHIERRLPALVAPVPLLPQAHCLQPNTQ